MISTGKCTYSKFAGSHFLVLLQSVFPMILYVLRIRMVFIKNITYLFYNMFLMISGGKYTYSKFGGSHFLLLLQWIFNDFVCKRRRGQPSTRPPPTEHGAKKKRDTKQEPFAIAFGKT